MQEALARHKKELRVDEFIVHTKKIPKTEGEDNFVAINKLQGKTKNPYLMKEPRIAV